MSSHQHLEAFDAAEQLLKVKTLLLANKGIEEVSRKEATQEGPANNASIKNNNGSSHEQPRKRGRPKGRKTTTHPSLPRPQRPLSAYNLFFRDERQKIISAEGLGEKKGKVTFSNLAKTVGHRWKTIDEETKKKYEKLAEVETKTYNDAMRIFNEKLEEITKKEAKKKEIDKLGCEKSSKKKARFIKSSCDGKGNDDSREEKAMEALKLKKKTRSKMMTTKELDVNQIAKKPEERPQDAEGCSSLPLRKRRFIEAINRDTSSVNVSSGRSLKVDATKSNTNGIVLHRDYLMTSSSDVPTNICMQANNNKLGLLRGGLAQKQKLEAQAMINERLMTENLKNNLLGQQSNPQALRRQLANQATLTAAASYPGLSAALGTTHTTHEDFSFAAARSSLKSVPYLQEGLPAASLTTPGNINNIIRKRVMELEAARSLVDEIQYSHDVAVEAASIMAQQRHLQEQQECVDTKKAYIMAQIQSQQKQQGMLQIEQLLLQQRQQQQQQLLRQQQERSYGQSIEQKPCGMGGYH